MKSNIKRILIKFAALLCMQTMVIASVCSPVFAGNDTNASEKAHAFDGGIITKKPTCTKPGTTKYTCVDCGFVLEDNNFPLALSHSADLGQLHKGTQDVSGYVQYHCIRCGIDMGLIPVNTDGIVFPEEKVKNTAVAKSGSAGKSKVATADTKSDGANQTKEDTEVKANDETKPDDKAEADKDLTVDETNTDNSESVNSGADEVNAEETKDKADEEIADAEKFGINTLLSSNSTAGEKLTDKEKKSKQAKAWEFIESLYRKGHNPVKIKLNDSTLVPNTVFLLANEYNATTEFIVNDKVSWTILPGDIDVDSMSKISRINVGVLEDPQLVPNEVAASAESLQNKQLLNKAIDIKHGGSLGFTGVLSVKLNDIRGSEYANLFLYNEDTNALEYISSTEIPDDRFARFNISKGATYAIYTSRLAMNQDCVRVTDDDSEVREKLAQDKQTKMDNAKKQSETDPITIGIIIVVVAVILLFAGMLFFQKNGAFDIASLIKKDNNK